ncbi:MAG: YkgJ family cysteine cluster protein [Promethearchaeota archaeon]
MTRSLESIRFKCVHCGACCSSRGLIVNLTPRDLRLIARHLKIKSRDLLKILGFYLVHQMDDESMKLVRERMVLPELKTHKGAAYLGLLKRANGECIFLKNGYCSIYPVRPRICQAFPFTFRRRGASIEISLTEFASNSCPGVGKGSVMNIKKLNSLGDSILRDIDEFISFSKWWNNRETQDVDDWKPEVLIMEMIRYNR